MIDSVGNSNLSNVQRVGVGSVREVASSGVRAGGVAKGQASGGSMIADLAAAPAPVQSDRVSELRAAIAEGRYGVDAAAIARKMIGPN